MYHILRTSTTYCMRTAKKVWRSERKKYLPSVKKDTQQTDVFVRVSTVDTWQRGFFVFFLQK